MARRGLQRRVNLTLGALVLTVAAAVAVSFALQRRADATSDSVRRAESGLVAVLRLSINVRDAYAHQAHVVILNDGSHVDHYEQTAAHMARAAQVAANAVAGSAAAAPLQAVIDEARLLDENFRRDVVPKIGGERAALLAPAEEAISRVERMQNRIDEAASILAQEISGAHASLAAAALLSRRASAALLAIAILVALLSVLSLDRSLSAPLRRLESATEGLARGNLQTRIDHTIARRDDELGSLAVHFNAMASALAEREAKLLEAERLAAVGRLAAGVAHEINNPLGVILGTARLLGKSVDATGQRDVDTIVAEVQRCRDIVGGLLDLARPPRLRTDRVELRALCDETVTRLASATAGSVTVGTEGDTAIDADADKVRQILTNLLLNAAQAGATHTQVLVDGTAADAVRVSIRDDGPGVSADLAPRLFQPFATGRAEGTGLGLAVSRAIALAHGGALEHVPSAAGARFDLRLPRRASSEVPA